MEQKKIFVYGSLREGFFNYEKYLKGKVIDKKLGRTKGKLYHLQNKGYPALVDGDDYVYGELVSIDDYEKNLKELDKLENYNQYTKDNNEYNREVKKVEILGHKGWEKAYVYVYNIEKDKLDKDSIYIPHGDWRKYMNDQEDTKK